MKTKVFLKYFARGSNCSCFLFLQFWISFFVFTLLILFIFGDIKLTLAPKNSYLNRITAQNFAKVNLLQAYNAIHNFDLICLSESYLGSFVSSDNLYIKDYKLVRADRPGNVKRSGVFVYIKESLPVSCLPNPYFKNVLSLKYQLTISDVAQSPSTLHQVKLPMILTPLPLIQRNVYLRYLVAKVVIHIFYL